MANSEPYSSSSSAPPPPPVVVVSNEEEDNNNNKERISTHHHQTMPSELTQDEFAVLSHSIDEFHTYQLGRGRCSSLLAQRINAPPETVWSVVRRFDRPQIYKHFIKSCHVDEGFEMRVGSTRDVNVISGLPANTSRERLDLLDDDRRVTGFSITGGEHRLRNYKSVTTVHRFEKERERIWTVVLESYVVDVPEGNSEEDTRLFADTVIRLNLQKLASITEAMNRNNNNNNSSGDGTNSSSSSSFQRI
ncbi:PREDICTED: abscisic acid receptor PYL1-like [Camelina sativa]|uniref:Abscisic acid receptor PYL1-like n=1 Tax=Camelina sativa TaxID=90675 RepID=A0ABM0UI96_CAMSA|nr:PREDICTED: abscisic acid receptor PYL1-like [Camelina sativa]